MIRPPLLTSIALAMLCQSVVADDRADGLWYISPMIAYIDDDRDRNVDDGAAGIHLGVGRHLSTRNSIEFNVVGGFFNSDGFDADQRQWGIGVDYLHHLKSDAGFQPYLVIGTGYMKTQIDGRVADGGRDGGSLMASAGAGFFAPLGIFDTSLRTEIRLRFDKSVGSRREALLGIGASRAFGKKKKPPRDTDGDGVRDENDRCGATPRGVTVDPWGCARGGNPD